IDRDRIDELAVFCSGLESISLPKSHIRQVEIRRASMPRYQTSIRVLRLEIREHIADNHTRATSKVPSKILSALIKSLPHTDQNGLFSGWASAHQRIVVRHIVG